MIEKLNRIAQSIRFLYLPSIFIGLVSLASVIIIILSSGSHDGNRFLIPSIVGFLWSVSAYSFIGAFCSIPEGVSKELGFFKRLKHRIHRVWYWLIGVLFLCTNIVLILFTIKIIRVWLKDF